VFKGDIGRVFFMIFIFSVASADAVVDDDIIFVVVINMIFVIVFE
jgi:hypothetical protein